MSTTIQSIFHSLEARSLIPHTSLNKKQNKLIYDIIKCKTSKNGFNKDCCDNCGDIKIHYNSCKNPSCPQCQAVEREVWILKEKMNTLFVRYFHVVFTIPADLNPLVMLRPKTLYSILFEAAASTLKELSEDDKYLGAQIGFTAVLHTWGQNLSLHPHLHIIVSGGGIDSLGKWKNSKKKFFLPVKVMSEIFRGKFLSLLKKKFPKKILSDDSQFQDILDSCYSKDWVVYTKKPMKDPKRVIEYLSRYTHRIAISNGRLIAHENGKVTFRYKDYKDHNKIKEMTLDEQEFFRRFMMHVLPKGFMKIRHFGFLGNRNKKERLKTARTLTNTPAPAELVIDYVKIISKIIKRDVTVCLACGQKRHHKLE